MIFQNEKRPVQALKSRSLKRPKIDIFFKGLIHCNGPKMAIFPTFYFQSIQASKMSFMIFQNEKTPVQAIKTKSSKSGKSDIFQKGFGPKMAIFPTFCQAIQARKMSFMIFQNKETPFLAIKTRSSNSRKIDIFPNGLTHGFGAKMAIFAIFLSDNIGQENVFYDILERKNAFLGYKKEVKKVEKLTFFQRGNPWFWSKNGHFSNFFFTQYRPGKCIL